MSQLIRQLLSRSVSSVDLMLELILEDVSVDLRAFGSLVMYQFAAI